MPSKGPRWVIIQGEVTVVNIVYNHFLIVQFWKKVINKYAFFKNVKQIAPGEQIMV